MVPCASSRRGGRCASSRRGGRWHTVTEGGRDEGATPACSNTGSGSSSGLRATACSGSRGGAIESSVLPTSEEGEKEEEEEEGASSPPSMVTGVVRGLGSLGSRRAWRLRPYRPEDKEAIVRLQTDAFHEKG